MDLSLFVFIGSQTGAEDKVLAGDKYFPIECGKESILFATHTYA